MVDWSSNSRPTSGNDSIWVAAGGWSGDEFAAGAPENLATRLRAVRLIAEVARAWADEGKRVLIGMDIAFGYPAGFADALGLNTNDGAWRAVHEHVAREVSDDVNNRHNRDVFADVCNRRITPSGPGPFWACTTNAATSFLTQQRQGVFQFPYAGGIAEWRTTDMRAKQRTVTQSVWKLNCGVSVGGQTIVGIKHLHTLAEALDARRWPFDTGWTTPAPGTGCVWFAEIFPSLVRYKEWDAEYAARRDRTQVQSCVRRAAEEDSKGMLFARFGLPAGLTDSLRARDWTPTKEGPCVTAAERESPTKLRVEARLRWCAIVISRMPKWERHGNAAVRGERSRRQSRMGLRHLVGDRLQAFIFSGSTVRTPRGER
jgi:hypothetical protein